jgi:hypothetical protein
VRRKLPLVLSATALAVALLGSTPLGAAAKKAVPLALFANNSDRVDGFHAAKIPRPGYLVPLGPNGKFPAAVGLAGPPGDPGPAGAPGVSGLVLQAQETTVDGSNPKTAKAVCPSGKKVLGGGAALTTNTAGAPVVIQDSYPLDDGSGWFAAASRTGTFTQSWALKTWAVCATVS